MVIARNPPAPPRTSGSPAGESQVEFPEKLEYLTKLVQGVDRVIRWVGLPRGA